MLITLNNLNGQAIFYVIFLWHFYWCHTGFVLVSWIRAILPPANKTRARGFKGNLSFSLSQGKTAGVRFPLRWECWLHTHQGFIYFLTAGIWAIRGRWTTLLFTTKAYVHAVCCCTCSDTINSTLEAYFHLEALLPFESPWVWFHNPS